MLVSNINIKRRFITRFSAVLLAALLALLAVCTTASAEGWTADFVTAMVTDTATKLNPLTATNRDVLSMDMLVYESLIELDDAGKPTVGLATSWTAEDAGWTWYFTLREDVQFHNGSVLTAADAAASLNYIRQNECGIWYQPIRAMIDSCEATDTYTLKVTARHPSYALLYAMTFPIVPQTELSSASPSGTGPYYILEAAAGSRVRLIRNDMWWKRAPTVRTVEIRNFSSFDSALGQLEIGAVDAVATRSTSAARFRSVNSFYVSDYVTRQLECLIPNLRAPSPMADINMRRAVMEAIDKQSVVTNVYLSMATQADACVAPGDWLYEPTAEIFDYDTDKARQYLTEAGYIDIDGSGTLKKRTDNDGYQELTLRLITYEEPDYPARQDAATLIANQLRQIGITVSITVMSSQEKALSAMREGNYDLALVGYYMSMIPDLSFILDTDGAYNLNGYTSATMDGLLDTALASVAESAFQTAISDIQKLIAQDLPILSLYFRGGSLVSRYDMSSLGRISETDAYNGLEYWTGN